METISKVVAIVSPVLTLLIGSGFFFKIRDELKTSQKARESANTAIRLGIQALLRDRLYALYEEARVKGKCTIDELDNFENLYTQYHNLGQNGVMDSVRERMQKLLEDAQ